MDAAAELIRDEGPSAVTARRLAERVGLKRESVHYYFGTIEDLFVALLRRDGEAIRRELTRDLASVDPLKTIWRRTNDARAFMFELTGLAMRRKALQEEMKRFIDEFRAIHVEAVTRHLEQRGIKPAVPPAAMVVALGALSQTLALERALNVDFGHAEAQALAERWIEDFALRGDWSPRSASDQA
jgi:AcrR family transcriptional regulator